MTDQITLNADLRERTGTNKAREIRNVDGMVPAIVYGDEKETPVSYTHLTLPTICSV